MPSNLRRGSGGARGGDVGQKKGKPGRNRHTWITGNPKDDKAAQKMALKMMNDPVYRKTLMKKLRECTLHPSVHVAYLYMAYGRPKESVEVQQVVPVKIEHIYTEE